MIVRSAEPCDADAIASVHVQTSRQAYAGILPEHAVQPVPERARRWAETIAKASLNESIFVAVEDFGNIVGLAHCGPQRTLSLPFAGEFFAIYVLPRAQRHGAGRALMTAMARFLIRQGMLSASLWVARDNANARDFYEKIGGSVIAEAEEARENYKLVKVAYGWWDLGIGFPRSR